MSVADSLLSFTLAAALLTLTPGIDTALVLRTAAVQGKPQAVRAALGINAGCLLWGTAVVLGLGALVAISDWAFHVVKYCGAAYLCWLGGQMILRSRSSLALTGAAATRDGNWFVRGMLGNVLNPKVGVFYVSFLPQFVPQGQPVAFWTLLLVAIHVALGFLWSMTLIGATRPLASLLQREGVLRWMDRTTGFVFLLFAVRLALSKRV